MASPRVKQASLEELRALPWLPDASPTRCYAKIHGRDRGGVEPAHMSGPAAGLERAP